VINEFWKKKAFLPKKGPEERLNVVILACFPMTRTLCEHSKSFQIQDVFLAPFKNTADDSAFIGIHI